MNYPLTQVPFFLCSRAKVFVFTGAIQAIRLRYVGENGSNAPAASIICGGHYTIMATGEGMVEHLAAVNASDIPDGAKYDLSDLAERISISVCLAIGEGFNGMKIVPVEDLIEHAKSELAKKHGGSSHD